MMTYSEYVEIWSPACDNCMTEYPDESDDFVFAELLGLAREYVVWQGTPTSDDTPMTDELRNLLLALSGPHSKAILKAYRIRRS